MNVDVNISSVYCCSLVIEHDVLDTSIDCLICVDICIVLFYFCIFMRFSATARDLTAEQCIK